MQTVESVGRALPPVIWNMRLKRRRNYTSKIIGRALHVSVRDLASSVPFVLAPTFRIDGGLSGQKPPPEYGEIGSAADSGKSRSANATSSELKAIRTLVLTAGIRRM